MLLSSSKNRLTDEIPDESYPSSSSVVVSNVDLVVQILLCIPVKSLLVFKSVSKQWLSLISNPSFTQNHYLHNCLSIHGLILDNRFGRIDYPEYEFVSLDERKITNDVVPFKTLNFLDSPLGIKIEQSCSGLLCCSTRSNLCDQKTYYIYNPCTKCYRLLPLSQVKRNDRARVCSVSLAFDPLKSPYYEVIGIWEIKPQSKYEIKIYSSKIDSWKLCGDAYAFPEMLFYAHESGVFWNGSLHWLNLRKSRDMIGVYFDVGKGVIGKMPLPSVPDEFRESWIIVYFGECRGHLHLVISYDCSTRLDIHEIDTDYTGWNTKYCVDLKGLLIACPEISPLRFQFFIMLVKEEEDSSMLVLILNNKAIISYDLKEISFMKIHNYSLVGDDEVSRWVICCAYQYIETLSCV